MVRQQFAVQARQIHHQSKNNDGLAEHYDHEFTIAADAPAGTANNIYLGANCSGTVTCYPAIISLTVLPIVACASSGHLVCPSLWWFNGVSPQPTNYQTKLQATPAKESDYSWNITAGAQYAQFSNNSSTIDTKGVNSVEVLPNGDPGNGTPPTVSVTVTVKTKSGSVTSAPFSLNPKKPYALRPTNGACGAPACDGADHNGFMSRIWYRSLIKLQRQRFCHSRLN